MSDSNGITVKTKWTFYESFIGIFGQTVLVWKDGQGNQMRILAEKFWAGVNVFYQF